MSFFRRFSSDHRAARAAEAAGDPEVAAQHYALAGDLASAVRMHLARAARAPDRVGEIAALRDALHWAGEDPELVAQASAALGRALYAKAKAEGIATSRDRERVREAAGMLAKGGAHKEAGDAYRLIGDLGAAAQAYSDGGLVDRVETALAEEAKRSESESAAREAYADYELHRRLGRRTQARLALEACLTADPSDDRRRLLDALRADLITGGRVELRPRGQPGIVITARPQVTIGRDALCDLPLRAGGVSRRHAELEATPAGFTVRDGGSRNGTLLGGLPIAGKVALPERGSLALGEDCRLDFEIGGTPPIFAATVATGLDRGRRLIIARPDHPVELTMAGLACEVLFQQGEPWLGRPGATFLLCEDRIGSGRAQLIAGDVVVWEGVTLDVLA